MELDLRNFKNLQLINITNSSTPSKYELVLHKNYFRFCALQTVRISYKSTSSDRPTPYLSYILLPLSKFARGGCRVLSSCAGSRNLYVLLWPNLTRLPWVRIVVWWILWPLT